MTDIIKFSPERLIAGDILRCVDGQWSNASTKAPIEVAGLKLIALACTRALQRWHDEKPIETITEEENGAPLTKADADVRNAEVPQELWERDKLNDAEDARRPPWVLQHVVYFFDPRDASTFTFLNSTIGSEICVNRLRERMGVMQSFRGATVRPIVALAACPMKTKRGTKMRPDIRILDWVNMAGGAAPALPPATTPLLPTPSTAAAPRAIGKPVLVQPLRTGEELSDEIPF